MKTLKLINKILICSILIADGIAFFMIAPSHPDRIFAILSTAVLPFLPTVLRKISHISFHPSLELIYLIFLVIASYLGSVINLYKYISWYDIFAHTISGFLTGYLAIYLLIQLKHYKEKDLGFQLLFIMGIVFLVAGLWEFFEFGSDCIIGSNMQHVETGVRDTMEDMLVAFLGGFLFSVFYSYEMLHGKVLMIRSLMRHMK